MTRGQDLWTTMDRGWARKTSTRRAVRAASLLAGSFLWWSAEGARADDTIKHPGEHPDYAVEIEPHGVLGWYSYGNASSGFGIGGRFSIPIVKQGFVPSINNSVAIGFGLDFLHYSGCYFLNYNCSVNYLFFPVVLQWNFFVAERWSVFGEPGFFIYHGFYDDIPCGLNQLCSPRNATGLDPAFYVGGRYHFSEHAALTMRIGYPTLSVGVSFM